jgi:hypothetical protein
VYYPLCIGHRVRPSTGPGLDYPLFRAIEVYGRAFDEAATLSLYVSSGMNSDSVSLSAVTLAGDGPDGPTLSVPVDGLYAARALSLQTPLQLMMGEMLYLRVDTGDGTMDLMTYGIG